MHVRISLKLEIFTSLYLLLSKIFVILSKIFCRLSGVCEAAARRDGRQWGPSDAGVFGGLQPPRRVHLDQEQSVFHHQGDPTTSPYLANPALYLIPE